MKERSGAYAAGFVILAITLLFGWQAYKFAEDSVEKLNIHFKTMDEVLNGNP